MVNRALIAAIAGATLLACDSATMPGYEDADVYEFRLLADPPLVLHWPLGSEIRVYVNGGTGDRAALLTSAFTTGARAWNRVALWDEYRLEFASGPDDADVVLTWSDLPEIVDLDGCPQEAANAVTTFCVDDDGLQTFPLIDGEGGRVKMVVTVNASPGAVSRVRELVAHELGHVLGIGAHSDDAADLMWGSTLNTDVPGPRDAATVRVLYHTHADVQP